MFKKSIVSNTRTNAIAKKLGLKAEKVGQSPTGITWVDAPADAKIAETLKAEGYAFSTKRQAWWLGVQAKPETQNPEPKAPKAGKKAQAKPEAKPKATPEPKAPKFEPLPVATQDEVLSKATEAFPKVNFALEGTWIYAYGPETRNVKEALKGLGFFWCRNREAWGCKTIPAAWMPAQEEPKAPKAEPKTEAKPQPKAEEPAPKAQPEGEALKALGEEVRRIGLRTKQGKIVSYADMLLALGEACKKAEA